MWFFRYRTMRGGKRVRDREPIGMVSSFATKSSLLRAMDLVRIRLMEEQGGVRPTERTFGSVIARYEAEEMPARYATAKSYKAILRTHITPKWSDEPLASVRPNDVRKWLLGDGMEHYSSKYRGHIHGLMRVLFRFAMLWEWIPQHEKNPMALFSVPGASKREKEPQVLSLQQFTTLLEVIHYPYYRVMVILAMGLGLRCSELTALRWGKVNFLDNKLLINRGIVEGHEASVKTIHSKKELPLHPLLAAELLRLRQWSQFKGDSDFVFGSPWLGGDLPFRSGNVQTKVLVPAGQKIKLPFRLGWHTFRHTYKTMLDERGVPLTVQRDLMRHADTRTTAQVYGNVNIERMRDANSDLVEDMFGGGKLQ
jgi:integrase